LAMMTVAFEVNIEWLEAPGVTTPELAATWARYEIWIGDRCITQVEASDRTFRRSVYGSLYPLAQWIASNWWLLTSHVRPSAVETRYWTWQNVRAYPWLSEHNFRGAGDGMPWPDLTVVTEGAVTCMAWSQDRHRSFAPVRFASEGRAIIHTEEARVGLAGIVNRVLERLAESKLPKTQLAEEWEAIAKADYEERDFCRTVARLGLDPYSINEQTADEVIRVAADLPVEVADDFFDSADVTALAGAAEWTRRAMSVAERASAKASETLRPLYKALSPRSEAFANTTNDERPWTIGYAMARQVRREVGVDSTEQFDTSPWVRLGDVSAPSNGIHGVVTVARERCGLVLDSRRLGVIASRFGQARALGRALTRPEQQRFVLSAARGQDEQVAGAFAAELLAPADGIRASLDVLGKHDDDALEAIARRFKVSPLLVRHQYDNQIAMTSRGNAWY
jgi:hypothetical protein